jgi:PAS domain S-box-containing protein
VAKQGETVVNLDGTRDQQDDVSLMSGAVLAEALEAGALGAWAVRLKDKAAARTHARIFGYADELAPWTLPGFLDHVVPEDRAEVEEAIGVAAETGSPYRIRCRIRRTDGEVRWILISDRKVAGSGDEGPLLLGVVEDITPLVEGESRLRLKEVILNNMAEGVSLVRVGDASIVFANPAFERLFGYEPGGLTGRPVSDLNAPADVSPEDVAASIIRQLKTHGRWQGEVKNRRKDGTPFWCQATVSTFRDAHHGEVWVSIHQDITERKRADEALRASEDRNRTLLQTAMDGFLLAGLDGGILEANDAYCRMSGYEARELLSLRLGDLKVVESPDELPTHLRKIVEQGELRFDSRHRRKDGSVIDVEVSANYQAIDGGRISAFFRDVTARKATEKALVTSLREKEGLLKEVHHRVKNNLQVIQSLLRLEAGRMEHDDAKHVLQDMQGRIRAMALLHETLYRTGHFGRVNLVRYLGDLAQQFVRAQAGAAAIRLRLDLQPIEVEIDQAIPCGLILQELLSNCFKHAFPEAQGGEIRVALAGVGSERVRMQVHDTGVGLPKDIEARRKNSLGLQLVADLAKQLMGDLEIGPGSTFTVTFTTRPVSAAA